VINLAGRAGLPSSGMTDIQPELWIDRADAAVTFYQAAFGARVLHRVGEGDDTVAQLAVGDAAFWISSGGPDGPRFSPQAIGGATGRTFLVVDDPDAMVAQAVAGGATVGSVRAHRSGRLRAETRPCCPRSPSRLPVTSARRRSPRRAPRRPRRSVQGELP
jgi:PhnB protein